LLRTQMGGCARETTRQRSGNEQFVALDGRKHDDQPNIEYVVDMVRVFVAWLGAGVLIWDSRAITGGWHGVIETKFGLPQVSGIREIRWETGLRAVRC